MVVLLCAIALKQHYSTASVNDLRWILLPTTLLVELVTGERFVFEAFAGYMNRDHSFIIAASCSGVNFMITAFLMLTLGKLWRERSRSVSWASIPIAAFTAYITTIVANTVRIAAALLVREIDAELIWLNPEQLHRFEGIVIYFGFLIFLFVMTEKLKKEDDRHHGPEKSLARLCLFPLLVYYATTIGVPLINGAWATGHFWEYAAFVFVVPLLLLGFLAVSRFIGNHWLPPDQRRL